MRVSTSVSAVASVPTTVLALAQIAVSAPTPQPLIIDCDFIAVVR